MKTTMKKIGGHRTSVEMAVENRKIVPFDRRGCGSLVSGWNVDLRRRIFLERILGKRTRGFY